MHIHICDKVNQRINGKGCTIYFGNVDCSCRVVQCHSFDLPFSDQLVFGYFCPELLEHTNEVCKTRDFVYMLFIYIFVTS